MTTQMATVTDGANRTYRMPVPVTVVNDPPARTLFGADYTPVADLTKRYPGAKYTAVYGPHGMPTAVALNAVPRSVALVGVSFKGSTDPAAVTTSLQAARRADRLILVETLHEMNRSTEHGGPTPAAYHANFDRLATVVRKLDPTGEELGLTQTFMGYAARHPEPGREWDKFARDDVDFVGVDLEWDDKLGTKAYPTPPALQGIALEIRDHHPAKRPVIYREFAWRQLAYDTTGRDLAQFYIDQAAYAVAHQVYAFSIYDTDGTTGQYRLPDGSPALAAAKQIIG
jgi:hypothetical protein